MKTKEEILFDHYQVDVNGAPILEDSDIFAAMDEYAKQRLIQFLEWYLGGKPSKVEVSKVISNFISYGHK
jgi:hypothetical protein